jgi:hypothetical protein
MKIGGGLAGASQKPCPKYYAFYINSWLINRGIILCGA